MIIIGGLTKEHYLSIRNHFIFLLGGKCQCGESDCNETDRTKLDIHHPDGTLLINGYDGCYRGRGRDKRVWELFEAYKNNNAMLLSKKCHKPYEDKQKLLKEKEVKI